MQVNDLIYFEVCQDLSRVSFDKLVLRVRQVTQQAFEECSDEDKAMLCMQVLDTRPCMRSAVLESAARACENSTLSFEQEYILKLAPSVTLKAEMAASARVPCHPQLLTPLLLASVKGAKRLDKKLCKHTTGLLVLAKQQDLFDWAETNLADLQSALKSGSHVHAAASLLQQCVQLVAFLHTHGIAHTDLKLENFVMDDTGTVYLIDFENIIESDDRKAKVAAGCHYAIRNEEDCVNCRDWSHCWGTKRQGTLYYRVPEMFRHHGTYSSMTPHRFPYRVDRYDAKAVDVWCLGMIASFLFLGFAPTISCTHENVILPEQKLEDKETQCQVEEILDMCCKFYEEDRVNSHELLNNAQMFKRNM